MTGWKERPEGGGRFALWLIRSIARYGGRSVGRLCLIPITAYFLAVRGPERAASRAFLQRALGRPARLMDVARHIHTFAATILDRVFLLAGRLRPFRITVHGLDHLNAALDAQRGLLLFGSHLGSFDVMRVLARERPDVTVRVVLDKGHNPAMTQLLDALNPELASTVIDAGQDGPSIVLAIKEATDAGQVVALLVDRASPGEPSVSAPFLGQDAPFPVAPWLIASALKVPVMLAFGLYRGGPYYELSFEPFSESLAIDRRERRQALDALVHRYAARLQQHALDAPYNWFNFFDFWQADDAIASTDDPGTGSAAVRGGRRPAHRHDA